MKYIKLLIDNKKRINFDEKKRRNYLLKKIVYKQRLKKIIKVNHKNLCNLSGRSKSFISKFGLSRHFFRKNANEGLIPGIAPSSW